MLKRLLPASVLFLVPLCAQPPEGGPPGQGRGATTPQNLKVLKADDDIRGLMRSYAAALGVQCGFCHVQGDFPADSNPHKATARRMISMTRDINAGLPGRDAAVTCYTCHRGQNKPETAPPPQAQPAPRPGV
jgi:hypothetical protein